MLCPPWMHNTGLRPAPPCFSTRAASIRDACACTGACSAAHRGGGLFRFGAAFAGRLSRRSAAPAEPELGLKVGDRAMRQGDTVLCLRHPPPPPPPQQPSCRSVGLPRGASRVALLPPGQQLDQRKASPPSPSHPVIQAAAGGSVCAGWCSIHAACAARAEVAWRAPQVQARHQPGHNGPFQHQPQPHVSWIEGSACPLETHLGTLVGSQCCSRSQRK